MRKEQKGFTIIELLVVIVIIGILVALALPNLFAAQARGRDSERKNDLKNLQQRLETYFNDNGSYPGPDTAAMVASLGGAATDDEYVDPRNNAYVYAATQDDGSTACTTAADDCAQYTLTADLENDDDPDADGSGNYVIQSVNQ